jgi:hypothetical protein
MGSVRAATTVSVGSGGLTARMGTNCPLSRLWAPSATGDVRVALSQGNVMPGYGDSAVEWTMLEPCRGVPGSGLQA